LIQFVLFWSNFKIKTQIKILEKEKELKQEEEKETNGKLVLGNDLVQEKKSCC
jgi:hypothetical protein